MTELSGAIRRALRALLGRLLGVRQAAESQMVTESSQCPQAAIRPDVGATLTAARRAVDAVDAAMWGGYDSDTQIQAVTAVLGRLTRDQLLAVATVLVTLRPPEPPSYPGHNVAAWIDDMRNAIASTERRS